LLLLLLLPIGIGNEIGFVQGALSYVFPHLVHTQLLIMLIPIIHFQKTFNFNQTENRKTSPFSPPQSYKFRYRPFIKAYQQPKHGTNQANGNHQKQNPKIGN
jgi:hypothetical protein